MSHAVRNFKEASLLALAAVAAALAATGCAPSSSSQTETIQGIDTTQIAAKDATLDAYRNRAIVIELEPGNHNPKLNWNTMYENFPGEEPVADRASEEDDFSLTGIAKKFIGGKSTKKKFVQWKDDPAGLQAELNRLFGKSVRSVLKSPTLKAEFIRAGQVHGVDPVAILACMVGENTFNVGMLDDIGQYAIQKTIWADKWALRFREKKGGVLLTDLVKRSEFDRCSNPLQAGGSHAIYWECVADVWTRSFMGKVVDGVRYPYNGFKWTFFNPLSTGYSYGPGQLDPIRALMVTDMVHQKSGYRLLSIDRPEEIYEDIIDPATTVHYVAANIRLMQDRYKAGANFDISRNVGVIASLYNLGGESGRAAKLYSANLGSLKTGHITLPLENYYGYYMNEKEAALRQAFATWKY